MLLSVGKLVVEGATALLVWRTSRKHALVIGVNILVDVANAVELVALVAYVGKCQPCILPKGALQIQVPVHDVRRDKVLRSAKHRARAAVSDYGVNTGKIANGKVAENRRATRPVLRHYELDQG